MTTQPSFLDIIVARKRAEVVRRKRHVALASKPQAIAGPLQVAQKLRKEPGHRAKIIAEVKFQSPSAGVIRKRAAGEALHIAKQYVAAGASAVSVLVDRVGFGGSALDVRRVARNVPTPVLFKEFVIDMVQIDLARTLNASLVLLIAKIVSADKLNELSEYCLALGLCPLIEVTNEAELASAISTRAPVIGVNARDLNTFQVNATAAGQLIALIPNDRVAVYMSGIHDKASYLSVATRADAVLMGESLMTATDVVKKLRSIIE